ncbi:MAG: cobalamin biosynthesis protein CobD [Rhodobacteraceae bacterium]|nr:cobalamin biosynthesis protein CobD [Paracoccaceae bacterium]
MSICFILLIAIILDAVAGDPKLIWDKVSHPVVLMGNAIDWFEKRYNQGPHKTRNGVFTIIALATFSISAGLIIYIFPLHSVIEVVLIAILLAYKSLVDHISGVSEASKISLEESRLMVSKIVGRDVNILNESGVARSTLESAAENLSDGFIAPIFWYCLLGLPGILAYKMINTADSMIAHKNERFKEFGWATAKLDDIVNFVPARVTALLLLIAGFQITKITTVYRDSKLHRSPNAGWPETAMAVVLGIALAGPRSYNGQKGKDPYINVDGEHELSSYHIDNGIRLLQKTWFLTLILVVLGVIVF